MTKRMGANVTVSQTAAPIGIVYWKYTPLGIVNVTVGFIVSADESGVTMAREFRAGRYLHGCTIPQAQVLRIESFGPSSNGIPASANGHGQQRTGEQTV